MKKFLLIPLLIFSLNCLSQETPSSLLENLCEYKTDGLGKSKGLKIKIKFPCNWKQADGDRPHVVKKFSYDLGDGSSLNQNIVINQFPYTPSNAEINDMLSSQGLKELVGKSGTFISGRKIKIDGIDCGEVKTQMVRETTVGTIYLYSIIYYLVYKDKLIVLTCGAGADNDSRAKEVFENYNIIFKSFANSLVILSKWE
ncbi:MAG: hypothetical protein RLZZ175_975 [Bacteroidota bacterium]|jgi:hypothetical protein